MMSCLKLSAANTQEEILPELKEPIEQNKKAVLPKRSKKPKSKSEHIRLNVGGRNFDTSRSTLCKYPGPLAKMFAQDSELSHAIKKNGRYFLDDDPDAFDHILFFLRYGELRNMSPEEANIICIVADKLCPSLAALLKETHEDLSSQEGKAPELTLIKKYNQKGERNWFICRVSDGKIIGTEAYGWVITGEKFPKMLVQEHNDRKVYKNLCLSWSGSGLSVYNCQNGNRIGDQVNSWETHEILRDSNKFHELDIIENAVSSKNNKIYVCTLNNLGTFSIFDSNNGEKMLPAMSFATIQDCLVAVRACVKDGRL